MRLLASLACAALVLAGAARAQDPLKSPACEQALGRLQAARASADASATEAARRQATQACLGGTGAPQRPAPVARAPISVPAPVITAPDLAPVQPPPPPVRVDRPAVITACDPGGCWDSNGTRLNRAGPVLLGPSGACSVSGGFVHCP